VIVLNILRIVVGLLAENCYIITNEKKEAIVIDPGDDSKKIQDVLQGYVVKEILVTHHHFDHIGAVEELEQVYGLKHNNYQYTFGYQVISTPGHTKDSVSYYFEHLSVLFDGDFVFKRAIGRTDLGGNDYDMKKSLSFLFNNFPKNTILYPGHGEATTIQDEEIYLDDYFNF